MLSIAWEPADTPSTLCVQPRTRHSILCHTALTTHLQAPQTYHKLPARSASPSHSTSAVAKFCLASATSHHQHQDVPTLSHLSCSDPSHNIHDELTTTACPASCLSPSFHTRSHTLKAEVPSVTCMQRLLLTLKALWCLQPLVAACRRWHGHRCRCRCTSQIVVAVPHKSCGCCAPQAM
jgi:hypothetical protein